MTWSELPFGRHLSKTLPQVLFADPDWFFWAFEQGRFWGALAVEADDLYRKATRIKIPPGPDEPLVAEYALDPVSGKFSSLDLVPISSRVTWATRRSSGRRSST